MAAIGPRRLPGYDRIWRPGTLLYRLSPRARDDLLALGAPRLYGDGQAILREGVRDTHVVLLLAGFAKVTAAAVEGASLLDIRGPGDVVGELAAFSGQCRSATVTACGPVLSRIVMPDDFKRFLERNPEAATQLTSVVGDRLAFANRRRLEFIWNSIPCRLARVINELATICGEVTTDGHIEFCVPLKQVELAALIGASEASVHKALGKLRAQRLVTTGYRRIVILAPDRLRDIGGLVGSDS